MYRIQIQTTHYAGSLLSIQKSRMSGIYLGSFPYNKVNSSQQKELFVVYLLFSTFRRSEFLPFGLPTNRIPDVFLRLKQGS